MGFEPSSDYESEITVRLGRLSITVREPARRSSGSSAARASASPSAPEPVSSAEEGFILVPGSLPPASGRASDEAFLAANTPVSLGSLGLGPAQSLVGQLRGADNVWTPAARVARALRAGISARRKLDGVETHVNASPAGLQNRIYICLRCPRHPNGFWTHSSQQYFEAVRGSGSDFAERSVSHAFASRAKTEAYLQGAERQWPPQLPLRA